MDVELELSLGTEELTLCGGELGDGERDKDTR